MQAFIRFGITVLCLLLVVVPAGAQGVVSVNSASYVNPALPNGSIAQGSMFIGFGAGLGPASIEFPNPWPFPTELAGTTIQVTVGGTTVDCFMVYSSAGQVAGILPSDTPLGDGTLTIRFNGSVAATGDITVVEHSFGIFTINQQGIGPVVATDPLSAGSVYSALNAAAPGDFIDIWGTGLGPVTGCDDEGPTVGCNVSADVQVYVANQEQPVLYAGRSGCCSAIDQVRIAAPNMSGCFLPVAVVVNGVSSNFGTIAIDPSGSTCTPDSTFGGPNFSQLQGGGTVETGSIALVRSRSSIDIDILGPQLVFDQVNDIATASYTRITLPSAQDVAAYTPRGIAQIGACTVFRFTGESAEFPELTQPTGLDAGAQLSIDGPGGADVLAKIAAGQYNKSFSTPSFPFLSPEAKGQITFPTYFEPGLTTVTAPGGADVGMHTASIVVPQDFDWTNKPAASAGINRNAPLPVNYSASGYDYVNIFGYSLMSVGQEQVGAGFYCAADPAAGSFTIPVPVLQSLPDSDVIEGFATGFLSVGGYVIDTFSASDLDQRTILYSDSSSVFVDFN